MSENSKERNKETCPHCGAEKEPAGRKRIEIVVGFYTERDPIYECGSCIDENWRHPNCYERQIAQLKQALIDSRKAVQTWAYYPEVK